MERASSSLAEAGDCVECALLPVAALALQIGDVHLVAQSAHHLLGEQVVHERGLDGAVVVHKLQQNDEIINTMRSTVFQ